MSDDLKDNEENIIEGENSSMVSSAGRSTKVSIEISSISVGCEKISFCSGTNSATDSTYHKSSKTSLSKLYSDVGQSKN